jgi:hypothetical protein
MINHPTFLGFGRSFLPLMQLFYNHTTTLEIPNKKMQESERQRKLVVLLQHFTLFLYWLITSPCIF